MSILYFLPVYLLLITGQAQWWYRCSYGCRLERYCKTQWGGERKNDGWGYYRHTSCTSQCRIIQTMPKWMTSLLKYYHLLNKNMKINYLTSSSRMCVVTQDINVIKAQTEKRRRENVWYKGEMRKLFENAFWPGCREEREKRGRE